MSVQELNKQNVVKHRQYFNKFRVRIENKGGFVLVIVLSLLVLLTTIGIGLLSLASIELRKSTIGESQRIAMSNARLGLIQALGRLQEELGDDRRITANASIFKDTANPEAVGVWDGWSSGLVQQSANGRAVNINYDTPKGQSGFRSWLVSAPDRETTRNLNWHSQEASGDYVKLFTENTSGFELGGARVPIAVNGQAGSYAWAVSQENTKAKINIGGDESQRINEEDRLHAPNRPSLANSQWLNQPNDNDWDRRNARVLNMSQLLLDSSYGAGQPEAVASSRHFTTHAMSLLTNPVEGGVKIDLSSGFEMEESEFQQNQWGDMKNPFRSDEVPTYNGQKPLYLPMTDSVQARVFMDFAPASVNHKFNVNGVPTFDLLRSHYRTFRHLYKGSDGSITAFERPYSHIGMPDRVAGRPFGEKTHPSLAPVFDRLSMIISIFARADGTVCLLLSPYVTIWNPYNIDLETEGLVVYPWIDFALFWRLNVTESNGTTHNFDSSLSQIVGEGNGDGHFRSTRPYFYLHLTETGQAVSAGSAGNITPIRLKPGEVRVFGPADQSRTELNPGATADRRVWQLKSMNNAQDIVNGKSAGIVLNLSKSRGGATFNYKLKSGDKLNGRSVEFDRSGYPYIVNMADSWHIKNSRRELMVEGRPAWAGTPSLPAEPNLLFYGQIHSGRAFGSSNNSFSYPDLPFELIRENPRMVGSILTYHRTALSSDLPQADLMFTTNPRQPFVTQYLGAGGKFQAGPHYESLMIGGSDLSQLGIQTTSNGHNAFYGASHSAYNGRSNLAFFEIPRSPTLSLGALQHCDLTATAFGNPSQIGNSWASPYLAGTTTVKKMTRSAGGDSIQPMLGVYDTSYLANEALFDKYYFSGATPEFGNFSSAQASPQIWQSDQLAETKSIDEVLADFYRDPASHPLRNPRMKPWLEGMGPENVGQRLGGPAKCVRIASQLLLEGGFNVNSTSVEAWTAMLTSLRGVEPASSNKTIQSRFRHVLSGSPANMTENDPWSGFRALSDGDLKLLAEKIVEEVKMRGPFLSLGEFVNRRIVRQRELSLSGAIQSAIDKSNLNQNASYDRFDVSVYPNAENLLDPNTGTNTPGWLTQADVLTSLAPYLTVRSDTFVIRSLGEARDASGKVLASARLEAVVQRVPTWVDQTDDPALPLEELDSLANQKFGRSFRVVSVRELVTDNDGNLQ